MPMSVEELATRLASEDPAHRHAAISVLIPDACDEGIIERLVAALEDEGSFEEEALDWGMPCGYSYEVLVADAAARKLEKVGMRAADALVAALRAGAGWRTLRATSAIVLGRESGLSDATLDALVAIVRARDGLLATRLSRRLVWERERREGQAATDARLDALEAMLAESDRELRTDAVWALGHAKGSRRAAEMLLDVRTVPIGAALAAIGPVLDDAGIERLADRIGPGDQALRAAAADYRDPPHRARAGCLPAPTTHAAGSDGATSGRHGRGRRIGAPAAGRPARA